MNKKNLTERDICTKFLTPAVKDAGWDVLSQIREQVFFTKGRIIVRGKLVTRGKAKFADYILYYKPNIPIALIEAKDNHHPVGGGMQQGLEYAATLDIPFVFSSNGDAFLFHDRTGLSSQTETELALDAFPAPEQLWAKYRAWKGLGPAEERIVLQDYHDDASGKEPRYYQRIAVNKAIEAIAKGQDRILLVMATGTGKTYTSSARLFRSTKTIFKRGDVLFGKLRPYLNKVLVADQDGVCTTEIIPIRGYCGLVPEYVKLVLKSPLTMARVDRLMYGMKMPRLGTGDAVALSFPLPPLAEQRRIVAKVDKLMALCDRLEAAQAERESWRDRLATASLHRLNNGADAESFREHALFPFRPSPNNVVSSRRSTN